MFLSLITGISLTVSGTLERVDRINFDIYHVLADVRHQPKSTVIAALDAEALACYPNTPLVFWGPHFAKAIARLKEAGAVAVALDIYFAITPEQWLRTLGASQALPPEIADYDQTFDQVLSEGRIILATNPGLDQGSIPVPLPAEEYLAALPNHLESVGLTNLHRDTDSRIRRMVPAFEGLPGKQQDDDSRSVPEGYQTPSPWWTFAVLAVKEGFGVKALKAFQDDSIFALSLINYCGPPKTIPRLSLASLLRDKGLTPEERSLINGRIVFIGSDHENFGDHQPTPYSQSFLGLGHRDMSGVEIHANIAETILNPNRIQAVPLAVVFFLWSMIMAAATLLCGLRVNPAAKYITEYASMPVLWSLGFVLFQYGYLLPQAGIFSSITLFFLLKGVTQALGAHDHTVRIIGQAAFDTVYHERRDRRKTDNKISTILKGDVAI